MYKVVWIARYANGMTRQEASDYWAGHHGPLMTKVSPVAGYVQSHVQGPLPAVSGVAEEEKLFDGYSCACLLYTSPSPRDISGSRMPSSA